MISTKKHIVDSCQSKTLIKRKIVILGGGESGIGAAVLASKKGLDVFLSDCGKIKQQYKEILVNYNISFEENVHSIDRVLCADEIIKSPGIPDSAEVIKQVTKTNIPVFSEIEFASRYTDVKIIGITGSNGKTTTTLLIHHILQQAGVNAALAGNIGKSLALQVALDPIPDYYVVELSSFQLDGIKDFKPYIAVLLNITPDHLNRYQNNITLYAHSKFKITQNLSDEDYFIYCADDELINAELKKRKITAHCIPFSINKPMPNGAWLNQNSNQILINIKGELKMSIYDLALQGKHNAYNTMAAGIAAKVLELKKESIRESLTDFQNIEHRLEFIATVNGIDFINDSKATNVNATWYALESTRKKVVWIVGGIDKGNDYSILNNIVKDRVKAIICLGKDNEKIHNAFGKLIPNIVDASSATEAVVLAHRIASLGDVVLLSPACASFDLFNNYEDRGHQFKNAVRAL